MHDQPLRRAAATAAAALAGATLALGAAPAAASTAASSARPVTANAAKAAAGWLARALQGKHHDHYTDSYGGATYPDYGNTVDGILGMDAAGVAQSAAHRATTWLAAHVKGYVEDPSSACGPTVGYSPGGLAKTMLAAEAQHHSVRHFGGLDLVARLRGEELHNGADKGLFSDANSECGYTSPITQSLALIGLSHQPRAADRPDHAAVRWLSRQQCADGGFLGADRSAATVCKQKDEETDATGFAVQALWTAGAHHAATRAAHWLIARQKPGGAFRDPPFGPNVNSTAIATEAMLITGHHDRAGTARTWIARHQQGCSAKPARRGSLDYQSGYAGGATQLLATTQGTQALAGGVLGRIDDHGASSAAPALRC